MTNSITRRQLNEKIQTLGNTEHLEIFKILQDNNVLFSENQNGIFFNLTTLDDHVLKQINDFVNYCCENKTELDEYDKRLKECKFRNNISNIMKVSGYQSGINEPVDKKERWKDLIEEVDKTHIVKDFIDKIHMNAEKQCAKRSGGKYVMSRKKFMKRNVADTDFTDELLLEEY